MSESYTTHRIADEVLSTLDVASDGKVVSAEVWTNLWHLVFTGINSIDAYLLNIKDLIDDWQAAYQNVLNKIDVLDQQYENLTTGLVHIGETAPTHPAVKLWIKPAATPYVNPIIDLHYDATSRKAQSGIAVAEAVSTKADANNVYTKTETNTELAKKQDKFATKTTGTYLDTLTLNKATLISGDLRVNDIIPQQHGATVANKNYVDGSVQPKYEKPASGIPKNDLSAGVQNSLDKADTALQSSDVDLDYSPTSTKPQSGKAVAQALNPIMKYITYSIVNNSGVDITSCNMSISGAYEIPDKIEDKPVVGIGVNSFIGCSSLTSITIPKSVVFIADSAFRGCENLRTLIIQTLEFRTIREAFYGLNITDIYYCGTEEQWLALLSNLAFDDQSVFNNATKHYNYTPAYMSSVNDKVDKIIGKQLSTEDYTTAEKTKLSGIEAGAEVNVNADWNATSGKSQILNKPTSISGYGITDAFTKNQTNNLLHTKADRVTTYTKTETDTALANKQDTLTAGANITIQNNVISAVGGETWRRIAEIETESEVNAFGVEVDSDNQPFQLKKLRAYIYSPADAGSYNGYIYLKESAQATAQTSSAAITFVGTSAQHLIFEAYANGDYPTYSRVFCGVQTPSPLNESGSFGRGPEMVTNQQHIGKFSLYLNSGKFPIGTRLIIEGVDA